MKFFIYFNCGIALCQIKIKRSYALNLSSGEKKKKNRKKNSGLNGNPTHDLFDTGTVLSSGHFFSQVIKCFNGSGDQQWALAGIEYTSHRS